ncbi:MAG: c-type cytochrome [Bdellovibrionota bacterium]
MEKPTHQNSGHGHHILPMKVYYLVWIGLIVLTVVTVGSSYIDFGGSMNILIAMIIATIKALLVILFFMGLKYEGLENNVTFFCTFAFLAIFVGLTSADIFYRFDTTPVKVDVSELPASSEPVNVTALANATPDMISKGKQLYAQNCVSCHGAEGKGDGPAAAALNPKPRNFVATEGWKNGRGVAEVFKTVTEGIPGTPMPPFSGLSPDDRFALVHFVRSVMPNPPASDAAALASLEKQFSVAPKKRLPVAFAMKLMAEDAKASDDQQEKKADRVGSATDCIGCETR